MGQVLSELLVREREEVRMRIRSLGYDPEADELDLLIDMDRPVPAESVPVGAGIYLRRDPRSRRVVGAFVRGYSRFLGSILNSEEIPLEEARAAGYEKELKAILAWQRKALQLSRDLLAHLGTPSLEQQRELVDALLALAS